MPHSSINIKIQKIVVLVSVVLFFVKFFAWYITHSVAVLTDALESIVNVIAGFVGLFSLLLSAKPKDKEHPYGHGKIEFISSAIEGVLILVAGVAIIYKSITQIINPQSIHQMDWGLTLIIFAGLVNYILGIWCVKTGVKNQSPALIASGQHLKTDTYSTIGLVVGLILILVFKENWIDGVTGLVFGVFIIFTGTKIIKKSYSGIMDESDLGILNEIIVLLNQKRIPNWIDVHNMRVINYAGFYHIDCHLTVPYYINVNEAHLILDSLTDIVSEHFKNRVEFFVHIDGCISSQCSLCQISDCHKRQVPFTKTLIWNQENILSNKKHHL